MRSRLETLRRLVTLYSAVEEIHSSDLQRKVTMVREAQLAIGLEQSDALSARTESREALLAADRTGWKMAESQREMATWREGRLKQICVEREGLTSAAREQYVASRIRREQLERVLGDIAAQTAINEERQTQAASDDRFLARRRWTDTQAEMRDKQKMKNS